MIDRPGGGAGGSARADFGFRTVEQIGDRGAHREPFAQVVPGADFGPHRDRGLHLDVLELDTEIVLIRVTGGRIHVEMVERRSGHDAHADFQRALPVDPLASDHQGDRLELAELRAVAGDVGRGVLSRIAHAAFQRPAPAILVGGLQAEPVRRRDLEFRGIKGLVVVLGNTERDTQGHVLSSLSERSGRSEQQQQKHSRQSPKHLVPPLEETPFPGAAGRRIRRTP